MKVKGMKLNSMLNEGLAYMKQRIERVCGVYRSTEEWNKRLREYFEWVIE